MAELTYQAQHLLHKPCAVFSDRTTDRIVMKRPAARKVAGGQAPAHKCRGAALAKHAPNLQWPSQSKYALQSGQRSSNTPLTKLHMRPSACHTAALSHARCPAPRSSDQSRCATAAPRHRLAAPIRFLHRRLQEVTHRRGPAAFLAQHEARQHIHTSIPHHRHWQGAIIAQSEIPPPHRKQLKRPPLRHCRLSPPHRQQHCWKRRLTCGLSSCALRHQTRGQAPWLLRAARSARPSTALPQREISPWPARQHPGPRAWTNRSKPC